MSDNKIALIGLGYVGLPLAIAFSEKYEVIGFDIDKDRVNELNKGLDRTQEVEGEQLQLVKSNIKYTTNIQDTRKCNYYIVTVPTPIDSDNRPDLNPLIDSSKMVGSVLSKNNIVVYESTVYPGVTEEICVPELEQVSGLKFNLDFFCGYSPERINPGDKKHTVKKILKVTSGSTPEIAEQVDDLYKQVITAGTHLASSIKVAEASKVIENIQRDVNIALINELAMVFSQIGINTQEVIEAASTKWNFVKYSPGLVGGHCISIDPYYLTFKAKEIGYKPDLILTARQINNGMSQYIAEQTANVMKNNGKKIKQSNILILGIAFKENCPDIRNTKVVDLIKHLTDYGANVDIFDPWVDSHEVLREFRITVNNDLSDINRNKYDAVVYAVAHREFMSLMSNEFKNSVIIDVKGIADNSHWNL
jgi:UDP-N-acetyl-D-glucosamine/UDP-N-acetyl-D-galactosamine dehydrogenase